MMLLLVSCVLLLLCVAYDDSVELVAFVFVVAVRPSSYADLRCFRCGCCCCECMRKPRLEP